MVRQYFNEHKLLIIATLVGISVVGIALLLWVIFKPDDNSSATAPEPVRLEYCGEDLVEPCVLSFGRDGDGNTIVNLFIPKKRFPAFYLVVGRGSEESRYECDKNEVIEDTVYCIGTPLNLDERIEISLFSKQADQLLAKGRFTLTAFLLEESDAHVAVLPATPVSSGKRPTATPTKKPLDPSYGLPTSVGKRPTATPTATSTSASYPSYP